MSLLPTAEQLDERSRLQSSGGTSAAAAVVERGGGGGKSSAAAAGATAGDDASAAASATPVDGEKDSDVAVHTARASHDATQRSIGGLPHEEGVRPHNGETAGAPGTTVRFRDSHRSSLNR